jgi:farnesyl-diphosphate farnesyltransferase
VRATGAGLLSTTLKGVSRTFYLTLRVLPASLRTSVGLAYLFARAADTIADTRLIPKADRLKHLEGFRAALRFRDREPARAIPEALTASQQNPAERELLARLEDCFELYEAMAPADRERVRALLLTITQGMVIDLERFPGEDERELAALETREDLDRYTYHVAGCVGEFWTDMAMAHRPALAGWHVAEMKDRGVRFGRGLQMTNVLRDIPRDLRIGRCYLPRQDLAALSLTPEDLLDPRAIPKARPLIEDLLAVTLGHYDAGWSYTMAIPRSEPRLRLACAWPLLIGLRTLALLQQADNLLDPAARIKVPRKEAYQILLRSTPMIWSDRALTTHFERLRKTLDRAL